MLAHATKRIYYSIKSRNCIAIDDHAFDRELSTGRRGRNSFDDALLRAIDELREPVGTEELKEGADELAAVAFPLVDQLRRLIRHLIHQLLPLRLHLHEEEA